MGLKGGGFDCEGRDLHQYRSYRFRVPDIRISKCSVGMNGDGRKRLIVAIHGSNKPFLNVVFGNCWMEGQSPKRF